MIVWVSVHGDYYAVPYTKGSISEIDIYSKDGQICWLSNTAIQTDRSKIFNNHPYKILAWHNRTRWNRNNKKHEAFEVAIYHLADGTYDNRKLVYFNKKAHIKKSLLKIPEGISYVDDSSKSECEQCIDGESVNCELTPTSDECDNKRSLNN